jgi:hypothetical protein
MLATLTTLTDLTPGDRILGLDNGRGGLLDVTGTVVAVADGVLVLANPGQRDRHVATCTGMQFHLAP